MTTLSGKTVLVTGGNGGIGLAMCSALGAEGAHVVIWGRDEGKNETASARLRSEGVDVHALVCDVSDEDQVIECGLVGVGRVVDELADDGGQGLPRPAPGSPAARCPRRTGRGW